MECDEDLSHWLAEDRSLEEASEQKTIFEALGLSTNYEDWLLPEKIDDCHAITSNSTVTGQAGTHVCEEPVDMVGENLNSPPKSAVLVMEEIANTDLKSWLREPDIHAKFDTALDLRRGGKKRKLDEEENNIIESQNMEV